MKVKPDENLPTSLLNSLLARGYAVDTVASEGLTGRSDTEVWDAARRDARFLITQDLDFSDVRTYRPGEHAGLLLVRLRQPGANALTERVMVALNEAPLETPAGCFAVPTDRKLCVRRPQ